MKEALRIRTWWSLFRGGAAIIAVAAAVAGLSIVGHAQAFQPPALASHVVDTANKLTPAQIAIIDHKLDEFRLRTRFAIVVFMVGSLEGEEVDDVGYQTFRAWGVGERGLDNGVLLLIAPNERKVRIETGKGVGGTLTDLQSHDIIAQIVPFLKAEHYYEAVESGSNALMAALSADASTRAAPVQQEDPTFGMGIVALLAIVLLAMVFPSFRGLIWLLLSMIGRGGGGRGGSGGGGGSGYSGGGGRSGGGGASGGY